MKLHELRVGQVCWQRITVYSGLSKRLTRDLKRRIKILFVDVGNGFVEASIDHGPTRLYSASEAAKWQSIEPTICGWREAAATRTRRGQRRLQTA